MKTLRTIRKKVLAIAALIMALVVSGMSAPAAYAGTVWQLDDSFESNPAGTWTFYHEGLGSGGFDINAGQARSWSNNAWLTAQSGWSSVGRTVSLTPFQPGRTLNCATQIYIKPFGTATVSLEVIDPSTWTYVALKTVTLSGDSYKAVTTAPFIPPHKDVFVRISLTGDGYRAVRIDDLIVQCQYG